MKRLAIALAIINQIYSMQHPEGAVTTPRTDYAARIYKLRLLIDKKDLKSLMPQMPVLMQRLLTSKQSIYEGHSNLRIVFKLAGKEAHAYKMNLMGNPDPQFGSYRGTIADFSSLLNDLYKKVQQQEQSGNID